MKKITLLAAGFLIGGAAFAQTGTISPVKYGIKVGVNLPKYHFANDNGDDSETKSTTNFHVTGYADVPLSTYFYVQPGISLQGKGGKFLDYNDGDIKHEYNTLELGIPINFVGKVPLGPTANFFLGAGPYVSFGISGEDKWTAGNSKTSRDLNYGSDSGDDLKRTDAGLNFLAGFELNSGFNIGAGYGLGLTDLRPNGDGGNGKMTNRVLSFSVGYSF